MFPAEGVPEQGMSFGRNTLFCKLPTEVCWQFRVCRRPTRFVSRLVFVCTRSGLPSLQSSPPLEDPAASKPRPALTVVPIGWTSVVTLIQAARHIAYSIAKVPSREDVRKDSVLPAEDSPTILHLDNFDEIRYLKKEIADSLDGSPSPNHVNFI